MSLFDFLLVAHLVGDWMFQTSWMADNKRGRPFSAACLLHCLVYTLVVGGLLASAVPLGLVALSPATAAGAVIFLFLTHWLIDGFNLPRLWNSLVNRTEKDFVLIVLDQTMHLVTLAGLTWWLANG